MISAGKFVFLATFFALILQSLYFFSDRPDEFLFIPWVLIFAGATSFFLLFVKSQSSEDAGYQSNLFLWAFSLRLWAGMILYGWGFAESLGDEDASGYYTAWKLAENWYKFGFDGFLSDLYRIAVVKQNVGQSLIWGVPTFFAGGQSRMIVSAVNSFAGAWLVLVIFRLVRLLFEGETARIAALLVTFWPSFILVSAGTSKEILAILFAWSVLYLLTRSKKGLSLKDATWAAIISFFLFIVRFYSIYLIAASFFFRIIAPKGKNIIRNAVFGGLAAGSIILFLVYSGAITRDFDRLEFQNQNMENWRKGVAEETGSGINIYAEYESSAVSVPVAVVYFFLAPFPWEVFKGSGRNAFAAFENIAIFLILIVGFKKIPSFFKEKLFELLPILVFCVLYAGFHIWGMANVGLAWRHKQTVMPLFLMLASFSIAQSKSSWAMSLKRLGKPSSKSFAVQPKI